MAIHIRPGTLADVSFLDSLQKLHTKQVGWMPTKQFEGKIKLGHVLVAEETCGQHGAKQPVGYCIGHDQYFKRDDVGIIYQMNVVPGQQRGLIGATLLKAMFDRAAYGCRLFCCWCAQDIAANHFWEAMGFVPLAFRSGSRGKGRTHIFWQRRIRAGDTTTPYWFPAQTSSGSIREDRIVLPISPGTHWSDAKPVLLPQELAVTNGHSPDFGELSRAVKAEDRPKRRSAKPSKEVPVVKPTSITAGGLRFAVRSEPVVEQKSAKPKREPKQKVKNDPRLIAAARELRDRWLEQVNSGQYLPEAQGKYDVSRSLEANQLATTVTVTRIVPSLPAPIAA